MFTSVCIDCCPESGLDVCLLNHRQWSLGGGGVWVGGARLLSSKLARALIYQCVQIF